MEQSEHEEAEVRGAKGRVDGAEIESCTTEHSFHSHSEPVEFHVVLSVNHCQANIAEQCWLSHGSGKHRIAAAWPWHGDNKKTFFRYSQSKQAPKHTGIDAMVQLLRHLSFCLHLTLFHPSVINDVLVLIRTRQPPSHP